jgi:hypothetical protein
LLAGEFVNQDKGEDTDEWALKTVHFCSSCSIDLTAYHAHKNSTLGNGMNKTALLKGFFTWNYGFCIRLLFL